MKAARCKNEPTNDGANRPLTSLLPLILALAALCPGCRQENKNPAAPPPVVIVARPAAEGVVNFLDFTGNTAAPKSVTVVARVEGYLEKIHFQDGQRVKQGELLLTIQQAQYKAQLKQAEAQVLAQKAALRHAAIELKRYAELVKQDAATQTMVDHWRTQKEAAEAGVMGAEAQVELARLNLGYTEVRAPLDGRIGRHLADVGSLVGAMGQQTSLAEINQIDPIHVYFTIDERELLRLMARNETLPAGAIAQKIVPANFGLLTEDGFPHQGYLDFASLGVTPTTGTLQLRGVFPNHDFKVPPGVFARVRVSALARTDVLLIPGEAVVFDQQGDYVLVVNARNVVERRAVKTGRQFGGRLAVSEGLSADDRVIVEGLLQAAPGRAVSPRWAGAADEAGR